MSCTNDPVIYRVPGRGGNEGGQDVPEGSGKTLEVCSFNIRYYNTSDTYPWSARKDAVVKFFKSSSIDFAGIQELRSTQAQDIVYNLGDTYGFYDINRDTGSSVSNGSGEGVGILYNLSRFTVKDKGFFWLADDPEKLPEKNDDGTYSSWHSASRRIVVWIKASDNYNSGQTVYFFATHFDHVSREARLKSSNLVIKKIQEITGVSDIKTSNVPVFLVGDFNCTYGSAELSPIRADMNDARTMSKKTDNTDTFNGFGSSKGSTIDHIFFGGRISADQYRVVTEDYGVKYISDHYPVLFQATYK